MTPSPFAVSQFTTMPQPFETDLELYQRADVQAIELCERKLSASRAEARDQIARVRDMGLEISSVQPRVHALLPDRMSPEPIEPEDRLAMFRQTIDLVAEMIGSDAGPLIAIGGRAPVYDFRRCWEAARRHYPVLADYAADRGLRIAYEPLHPVLMNVDTFTCTLADAERLIAAVDRPNFGLCYDVWHLWQERDLPQRTQALGDRILAVHVADWPNDEPRHTDDRAVPGQGRIDLPGIFAALREAGYRGRCCLEILSHESLSDSLWKQPADQVLDQSLAGLKQAWRAGEDR